VSPTAGAVLQAADLGPRHTEPPGSGTPILAADGRVLARADALWIRLRG